MQCIRTDTSVNSPGKDTGRTSDSLRDEGFQTYMPKRASCQKCFALECYIEATSVLGFRNPFQNEQRKRVALNHCNILMRWKNISPGNSNRHYRGIARRESKAQSWDYRNIVSYHSLSMGNRLVPSLYWIAEHTRHWHL